MLVGGFGAWYHNGQAVEYWGEANESYNADLAQRLGVCTSGFAVVPCESPPPPAAATLGPARATLPMLGPTPAGATRPFGH